ncbi:MAG: DUF6676 family protein [Actinomycetota bacterium]
MPRPFRTAIAALAALVVGVVAVAPAAAQSTTDIVRQVDLRGYATAGTVDADINELEALARDVAGDDLAVVLLESEWPEGNDLLAVDVVEFAEQEWTVLVLSPTDDGLLDVGFTSAVVDADALDQAADAAFDQPSRDPVVFARAFADGLSSAGSGGGGGGGGALIILLVIIAVVVIGFLLLRRSGKKQGARRIEDAKAELKDDIAGVANDILALGDDARVAKHAEARDHYEAGNAIYLRVDETLDTAITFDQVDDLDDDLELAAWHLDAAEALIEGDPVPDKPDTDEPWERGDGPAAASLPDPDAARPTPRAAPSPAPRPRSRSTRRRSSGGGMGSILGGVLGGVLSSGGGGGMFGGGGRSRGRGGLRTTPRSRSRNSSRPSGRRRTVRTRGRRRG